jgi:protein-S-isoprenylcysteine O-methyltransferase Ste14
MIAQNKVITPRLVIQLLFFVVVIPFLPLLITWRWGWWEAWAFGLTYSLGFVISRVLAGRRNPGLLAERAKMMQHADAKPWDRTLAPLVALGGGLIPLVAGLDARFDWSGGFNLPLKIFALIVLIGGFALGAYALYENRYFSGVVRIQTERHHKVVSTGPYGWVRHPGYAGALFSYLAAPLLLDSAWAFVPAGLILIALVVRTSLEDQTLQQELKGYRNYAKRVRYRLLPWIW